MRTELMDLDDVEAVSFYVMSSTTGRVTFEWRLWAHRTSFYIVARAKEMRIAKFSLHGPDPEHPNSPWWKFDITDDSAQRSDSGILYTGRGLLPLTITGGNITPSVRNVLRFRVMSELFTSPIEMPRPNRPVRKGKSVVLDAPSDGDELWVDVFVSDPGGDPYWGPGDLTAEANAGLGPLVNDAGQSLTLIARLHDSAPELDPTTAFYTWDGDMTGYTPARVVNFNGDADGVVWIVERDVPREAIAELESDQGVSAYPARDSDPLSEDPPSL